MSQNILCLNLFKNDLYSSALWQTESEQDATAFYGSYTRRGSANGKASSAEKGYFSEMPKLRVTISRSESITYARGYQSSDPKTGNLKTGNLKKPTKAPHERSSAT